MNDSGGRRPAEPAAFSAAAALRESEARLELATAAAQIGIWDWDIANGEMVYSPRARSICGLSPDEPVTIDKIRGLVHPDDRERTEAMVDRALDPAVREHAPYEYRIVRPDGSVRWVLAHGEAVFGEDGPVRYAGTIQDVTDRHELEAARRASELRLRLAIDAGRMAVWEVDTAADRLVGTPELNRLLGYPEDEPLTMEQVRAGYYPGERERLQKLGEEVVAGGDRYLEAEFRYIRPDGKLRWLLLRAEMKVDETGAPRRAVGVLMDITRRKRAEEALAASEARLKLALQAAGAGVFEWDLITGALSWSPEIFELFGIDPATPGKDLPAAWGAAIHPADRKRAEAEGERVARDGGSFVVDFRIRRPDGEQRWIRSRGTAVPGPDGRPAQVTGIDLDVTEQNRAAAVLRAKAEETERERDRIYELSSDLFAVAGFDGYLKVVNPAWTRVLGYDEEALKQVPFVESIHPDDRAVTAETVGLLRHGTEVRQFENRVLRADGAVLWMSWSAVAEGDRFYAVGRDVTREKEREEALRQAQKMEAVGQLTGGIAHDFNNLLQALHGNFSLIRRRAGDDEKILRWSDQGLQAAERGAKLTSQLLAFSRAQKLELRPVDLKPLLRGMEELLVRTLGPMIRVRLDLPEDAPAVLADPTQLEMAVLNLAINARDAMAGEGDAGGDLSIRVSHCRAASGPEIEPGSYLELAVSDSGSGMPPEIAARAFDPFFTTKGVGKGTGLGLSQVYGMAHQAGGTARIDSEPGLGTTVSLLLRCTETVLAEPGAKAAERGRARGASARVLLVDDDEDVRRFLADGLSDSGYAVTEAESGEAALAALDDQRPDLMLIDFAMPGMNGAELADRARAKIPGIPILFASGYADTAAIEAAVGPGARLLRKPFRIDELEAEIAAALAEHEEPA